LRVAVVEQRIAQLWPWLESYLFFSITCGSPEKRTIRQETAGTNSALSSWLRPSNAEVLRFVEAGFG
jgi:hypothetical protein